MLYLWIQPLQIIHVRVKARARSRSMAPGPPGPSCPLVFCVHQRNTTFPTMHRGYNALRVHWRAPMACERTAAQQARASASLFISSQSSG